MNQTIKITTNPNAKTILGRGLMADAGIAYWAQGDKLYRDGWNAPEELDPAKAVAELEQTAKCYEEIAHLPHCDYGRRASDARRAAQTIRRFFEL